MAKKIKKRVKFRIIPIIILLFISAILYFSISFLINTRTKNIFIYNNEILSDQEILELSKLDDYPYFYKTFSNTIKKRLMKNPIIKNVKVKRGFFNIFNIYIEEYKILLINKEQTSFILENGKKVDALYKVDTPILLNNISSDIYDEFISSFNEINEMTKLYISEVKHDPSQYDKTRFLLYMKDGNHVYVNISKMNKLNYYNEIYPTLNNKKGTLYLDSGNHFESF